MILALLAALLQAGTPVLAYARMAADNGLAQEICTAAGAKKIVPGADGTAREVAPDAGHGDPCQLCTGAGTTPIAILVQIHTSVRQAGTIRTSQTCDRNDAALARPPATGPPAGS